MHSNWSRLKSKRRQHDCAPCARLKLEREKDGWSKNVTILKYVKEQIDLNVYMCDSEVFNDVSFWLCVLNSPGVCQSFDHVSSSSLSWCCDDGGATLTDVCSPLCPSLELSAWWRKKKTKKKIAMPSQIPINQAFCSWCRLQRPHMWLVQGDMITSFRFQLPFSGYWVNLELNVRFYCQLLKLSVVSILPYEPSCNLRFSDKTLLVVPKCSLVTTTGLAFVINAPRLWNSLLGDLTMAGLVTLRLF